MKISLVILCLNEIESLKIILPRINKSWVDEIIFLDGGSTDGSIEYAEKLGFDVISQKKITTGYKGNGFITGYREGLEAATGDIVIIPFTPDGNMIPEIIPELVAKMREGYDMVTVSRYKDGAKSLDDGLISGFGNWMFTNLVNILFKADYTDVLGGFRAYRKAIIKELGLEGNIKVSIDTQLCIRCAKKGMKVTEIPGDEPSRIGGESARSIIINGFIELFTIIGEFFEKS